MTRARISRVDEAWLRMDSRSNPMVITGVFELGGRIDEARLRDILSRRLLPFERFTQRVAGGGRGVRAPVWETDPAFHLDRHIDRVDLPPPADKRALEEVVGALAGRPLARDRPLWRVHIVEPYAGGSALVFRLHHAIADGIALMRVLLSLRDDAPAPPSAPGDGESERRGREPRSLARRARAAIALAPRGAPLRAARSAAAYASEAVRLLALLPDARTELHGKLGADKRVAWSEPIPLAEMKAAGAPIGATVNDLLSAALAGALRRYFEARGRSLRGRRVRAIVPLNLRPPDEPLDPRRGLGNRFGLIVLELPVAGVDPLERVRLAKRRMRAIKGSKQAPVTVGFLQVLGRAPVQLETFGITFLTTKASLVLTNVPGPAEPIRIAGQPIRRVIAWVPRAGGVGLGVSLLSYAGQVTIGVISDGRLVPEPGELVRGITDELAEIRIRAAAGA